MLHCKNDSIDDEISRNDRGEEMRMVDPALVTGTASVNDKNGIVPVNVVLEDGTVVNTIKLSKPDNGTVDLQQLQNLVAAQIMLSPDNEDSNTRAVFQMESCPSNQCLMTSSDGSVVKYELKSTKSLTSEMAEDVCKMPKSQSNTSGPRKHRGGWPKGKKRKPEKVNNTPKSPSTAYQLFTMERRAELRQQNPDMSFAAQVKVMGFEWSYKITEEEKKKYFDMASKDKERYITELAAYEHKAKLQEKPGESTGENDVWKKNAEMLYCKVCDMYFSNLHNKNEHMLGSKHLSQITRVYEENMKQRSDRGQSEAVYDNSLSQSHTCCAGENVGDCLHDTTPQPVNMSNYILKFLQKNEECEKEVAHLHECVQQSEEESAELLQKYHDNKDLQDMLEEELTTLKAHGAALSGQLETLYMVPSLFGVTKPL